MKFLDKFHHSKKSGVVPALVETAEVVGASIGFGYVQNRYREKASIAGVPADLATGVVLKALAMFGGALPVAGKYLRGAGLHSLVDNVGTAGLAAFGHTVGAGLGAQASGVKRLLIKESDLAKAKAALPNATILGEIPKAPHGDYLRPEALQEMAK
jgi:hypothetical protein